jgi:hypothetical protein
MHFEFGYRLAAHNDAQAAPQLQAAHQPDPWIPPQQRAREVPRRTEPDPFAEMDPQGIFDSGEASTE